MGRVVATHGGGPAITNATHVGLDMRKETIAVALLRPGESVPDERTIPNTPEALRKLIRGCSAKRLIACHEADPTGCERQPTRRRPHRATSSTSQAAWADASIEGREGARMRTDQSERITSVLGAFRALLVVTSILLSLALALIAFQWVREPLEFASSRCSDLFQGFEACVGRIMERGLFGVTYPYLLGVSASALGWGACALVLSRRRQGGRDLKL